MTIREIQSLQKEKTKLKPNQTKTQTNQTKKQPPPTKSYMYFCNLKKQRESMCVN